MGKWIYEGYTKVHDNSRKHMIESWIYHCSECGHTVRTKPTREAILSYVTCPSCGNGMKGKDNE